MTGFFGKLPASGDFVARGLAPGIRPVLDRWLTLHLAEAARTPELWPDAGLRALIEGPGPETLALVVLPSRDTFGRSFPLVACCISASADQAGVDCWADAALPALTRAQAGDLDAAALLQALAGLPDPDLAEVPLIAPLIWTDTSPQPPALALAGLFPPNP